MHSFLHCICVCILFVACIDVVPLNNQEYATKILKSSIISRKNVDVIGLTIVIPKICVHVQSEAEARNFKLLWFITSFLYAFHSKLHIKYAKSKSRSCYHLFTGQKIIRRTKVVFTFICVVLILQYSCANFVSVCSVCSVHTSNILLNYYLFLLMLLLLCWNLNFNKMFNWFFPIPLLANHNFVPQKKPLSMPICVQSNHFTN